MIQWDDTDTICALSTPPGRGGISVIRLTGQAATVIARRCCSTFSENPESHRVYYGHLKSKNGETIDEVLLTYFAPGRSFTSQATVEISCHGNPLIVESILNTLVDMGARTARPGEFTFRAFMNGRLDLVQAESVLELIESRSPAMKRIALNQLRGELSNQLNVVKNNIIFLLAHIEADIDFSTENLEVISSDEVTRRLSESLTLLAALTESFRIGRLSREGLRVVLAGKPNSGKSSLLNFLLQDDRSIVSSVPGTTRDFIEARLMVDGFEVVLVDTAGLRAAGDEIEKIGIARSYEQVQRADLVFYLADGSSVSMEDLAEFEQISPTIEKVFVLSKIDLPKSEQFEDINKLLVKKLATVLNVSTLERAGVDEIKHFLQRHLQKAKASEAENVVLSARHFEGLTKTQSALTQALEKHHGRLGNELTSLDLREALMQVQEVLGENTDEAVIDKIFKEFCLGK